MKNMYYVRWNCGEGRRQDCETYTNLKQAIKSAKSCKCGGYAYEDGNYWEVVDQNDNRVAGEFFEDGRWISCEEAV